MTHYTPSQTGIMFDVDGTLLDGTDAYGREGFEKTYKSLTGQTATQKIVDKWAKNPKGWCLEICTSSQDCGTDMFSENRFEALISQFNAGNTPAEKINEALHAQDGNQALANLYFQYVFLPTFGRVRTQWRDLIERGTVKPFDDVTPALDGLVENGYRNIAAVTRGREEDTRLKLSATGLESYFPTVSAISSNAEQAQNTKLALATRAYDGLRSQNGKIEVIYFVGDEEDDYKTAKELQGRLNAESPQTTRRVRVVPVIVDRTQRDAVSVVNEDRVVINSLDRLKSLAERLNVE